MFHASGSSIATRLKHLVRRWHRYRLFASRLDAKFLALVFGTVLVGTLLSAAIILVQQHNQLVDYAHRAVQPISLTMQTSIERAMLSGDRQTVAHVLEAVATQAGFSQIAIRNPDGRVWLSAAPLASEERPQPPGSPLCQACHPSTRPALLPLAESDCQVSGDYLLHRIVVANQPACYECHGASPRILGTVTLETPLSSLDNQWMASIWQGGLAGVMVGLLLVTCISLALRRLVVQPVVHLSRVAAEIGSGNLDVAASPERSDELGALALAFDTMRAQLKAALVEKERRNHELQMLNEIARATSSLLDPQQVLDLTINIAVSSLGVEAGAIYLLERESGRFALHACRGMPECREMACQLWGFNRVLAGLTRPDHRVVSVPIEADACYGMWQDAQGRSFVGVPLQAKGVLLGAMTFVTHPGQDVTGDGARILKAMGEEIGVALANAVHYQDLRNQATLEERERLAREMHDSLAQALSYLKLQASLTDDLLRNGDITQAQVNLREVREIAGETYVDVREAIFGLRHLASSGPAFLPAFEQYLGEYRAHYGLPVELRLEEGLQPQFRAEVSLQLTRIVQEALTNIRKHARATQIIVHFVREDTAWRVAVEDNGIGFDSQNVPQSGQQFLGLQIMRERAGSIRGRIEINSVPGSGTTVTIWIPLEETHQHATAFAYSVGR